MNTFTHSMRSVMAEMAERDLTLGADGDRLLFRPSDLATPELVADLKANKLALLALIRENGAGEPIGPFDLRFLAGVGFVPRDPAWRLWPPAAREVYLERLGIGEDLGMTIAPGSEAEQVALREARRAAAGVPSAVDHSRQPALLDGVLSAFGALGPVTVASVAPRAEYVPAPRLAERGGA